MKYLISLYKLINEGIMSYDFKLISQDLSLVKYSFFDSVGNEYLVEFKNMTPYKSDKLVFELFYYVRDKDQFSVTKIVNVNPYRILKTVFNDIINHFLKKFKKVDTIFFTGLAKEIEKDYITSRTRIYKRYLDMNPPDSLEVNQSGNTITLKRKN